MKTSLFKKDFTMIVIGQIISLFGNNILRYALPLYLLNQTHSAALFGLVSACAFIPMILFSPIGGLVADRVNKRNIMVILDFSTAALITFYTLTYGHMNLVALLIIVMMILYGIQGAYQPAVQASLPALLTTEDLMTGNAVINIVNSLAGMIGPALGGVLFGIWGLQPVLIISIICFMISAIMEIFIHIPYKKRSYEGSILSIAKKDMSESIAFICKNRPEVGKGSLLLAVFNLVFSALVMIGFPVIITEFLGFSQSTGNQFLGYAQAFAAAGSLCGGILAGTLGKKISINQVPILFMTCSLTLLPISGTMLLGLSGMLAYFVITVSCFFMMMISTLLSIVLLTYVQLVTPESLIGKVMASISCLCMCTQPVGQLIYGLLFEQFATQSGLIILSSMIICLFLSIFAKKIFSGISMPSLAEAELI